MKTITQKFMGKNMLIDRLTAQLKTGGVKGDARATALAILQKRGHVDSKGKLTPAGKKRDAMTAEERAIDRSAKRTGRDKSEFTYNPKTNRATIRR